MNTTIIHPRNRVPRTPEHDLSDILIAPVSPWYRKPTPWWVDRFEEVGLYPIVEADEIAEIEDGRVEGVNHPADDVTAFENVESTFTADISIFEYSQGEHNDDGTVLFDDTVTFDNDLNGIEKDRSDFFEDLILVDEADNEDEDDTVMDVTFTGQQATFIVCIPARIVEDYAWELGLEDDADDDDDNVFFSNRMSESPRNTASVGTDLWQSLVPKLIK